MDTVMGLEPISAVAPELLLWQQGALRVFYAPWDWDWVNTSAQLFDEMRHWAGHVSAIDYPVFVHGRNYGGASPPKGCPHVERLTGPRSSRAVTDLVGRSRSYSNPDEVRDRIHRVARLWSSGQGSKN
jgi:hypothetical protein